MPIAKPSNSGTPSLLGSRRLLLLIGATLLAGCAGGGGGGGGGGSSSTASGAGTSASHGISLGGGADAAAPSPATSAVNHQRVAVIDGAYDLQALDASRVIDTLAVESGAADVSRGDSAHGVNVARVLLAGPGDEARLDLLQVSETSTASVNLINHAVGVAAERGARVIQSSYAGRYAFPDASRRYAGRRSIDSLRRITTSNNGLGSVYVVSAGNNGEAMKGGDNPAHASPDVFARMLVVGGSTDDGMALHPRSNFPGDDEAFQTRFLTAPFVWQEFGIQGTSYSSPHVAAKAATLASRWPHLTAAEIGQRLLDTANRDSPLFSDSSCGASGTANCGNFYMGQGEADLAAAMQPQGELTVPTTGDLSGERLSLDGMQLQLSAAFGKPDTTALPDLAAFDELDRDYLVAPDALVGGSHHHDRQRRRTMSRHLESAGGRQTTEQHSFGSGMQLTSRFDAQGAAISDRLDLSVGRLGVSAYRHSAAQPNPLGIQADSGISMMTYQPWAPPGGSSDEHVGLSASWQLQGPWHLTAQHDHYLPRHTEGNTGHAQRVALGTEALPGLILEGGVGQQADSLASLAPGSAALPAQGGTGISQDLRVSYRSASRLTAFAEYRREHHDPEQQGLLELGRISADAWTLGVDLMRDEHRFGLAYRQPLRVRSADALVTLPTGRTPEGSLMQSSHRIGLAPDGRQQDIELGYARPAGQYGQLQFNLMHTLEPGHDREAPADTTATLHYDWRF